MSEPTTETDEVTPEPGAPGMTTCVCGQTFDCDPKGDCPEYSEHWPTCPEQIAAAEQHTAPELTTEQIQRNLLVAQMAALGLRPDGTAL